MHEVEWLGLGIGAWLALATAVLVIAAAARYVLIERPRDRGARQG